MKTNDFKSIESIIEFVNKAFEENGGFPVVSAGNGGAGLTWVDQEYSEEFLAELKGMVPEDHAEMLDDWQGYASPGQYSGFVNFRGDNGNYYQIPIWD